MLPISADGLRQTEQEIGNRTAGDGVPLPASEYEIEPSDGGMPRYACPAVRGKLDLRSDSGC